MKCTTILNIQISRCDSYQEKFLLTERNNIMNYTMYIVQMQMSCIAECGLYTTQHGIHTSEGTDYILQNMDCTLQSIVKL